MYFCRARRKTTTRLFNHTHTKCLYPYVLSHACKSKETHTSTSNNLQLVNCHYKTNTPGYYRSWHSSGLLQRQHFNVHKPCQRRKKLNTQTHTRTPHTSEVMVTFWSGRLQNSQSPERNHKVWETFVGSDKLPSFLVGILCVLFHPAGGKRWFMDNLLGN